MAKDKGKKKTDEKVSKKGKGGSSDEFAKPSDAPAGGDGWSLTDGDKPKSGQNDGSLFLITPLREKDVEVTRGKKTETVTVIVADIVELNEKKPEKSVEHEGVFVWAKWVQGALRGYIGEKRVLGRLVKTEDSGSAVGYIWKLEDADDDDLEVARAYRTFITNPLNVKPKDGKKSKSRADEKPAKKKSKK